MNKKTFLMAAMCGAASMLAVSCTTISYPENYTVETNPEINNVLMTQGKCFIGLEPGRVYISDSFANVFKLEEMTSDLNEEGLLIARVTGRTSTEAFWPWVLEGTAPYKLLYTFVWFDKDGNCVNPPKKHVFARRTLPGDIVKFSFLAPNSNCKSYSFIVGLAQTPSETAAAEAPAATAEQTSSAIDRGESVPLKPDDPVAKPLPDAVPATVAPAPKEAPAAKENFSDIGRWD